MKLEPSEEQELMVDTFRSFFRREVPSGVVRAAAKTCGFDRHLWDRFAALGGHSIAIPEEAGGGGGSLVDAVLVGFEAGRALAPIPYADTVAALRAGSGAVLRLGPDGTPWTLAMGASLTERDGLVTGRLPWTGAGAAAGVLLALGGDGSAAAIVVGPGVTVEPLANMADLPFAALELVDAPQLARWTAGPEWQATVRAELRLLSAAQLVGCGRGVLDLAVQHVRERHQFNRPLGSFQVVQHRLADCALALDAAELLALRAAAYEGEVSELSWRSALAAAMASDAAEQAATEALQFFGGYGFALEYDVQLFLRYAKGLAVVLRDQGRLLDDALPDTSPSARPESACPRNGVHFRRGAAEELFAEEVRSFLAEHLTEEVCLRARETGTGYDPGFHRAMAGRGWICASLPVEAGGAGLDPAKTAVLWETMYSADAPVEGQQLSEIAAALVAAVGTDEQKRRILGPIVSGELLCALGYTEPDAGSDVAAVASKAERVAGGYLVNGTKMFTTMAHVADYVLFLVRTEPDVPKHRGLSLLLIPLTEEGIEIQPIDTLGGERTNATFYRDVFVPESMRLGPENEGWSVLNLGLAVERAAVGGFVGRARRLYDDMVIALTGQPGVLGPTELRRRLAGERAKLEAASVLCDRVYCDLALGQASEVHAAMAKIAATEAFKGLAARALDLTGPTALLESGCPGAVSDGRLEHSFRHAQVTTIYAGANEVLRNLIAGRGLGLPKGP